jgi:Holliday junction resolvasome RuvABC endonuclease subunit
VSGEFVWGVDVGVSRQAFGFAPLELDGGSIVTEELRIDGEAREGQRLAWLHRKVRAYARERAAEFPPAVAWIEQPSGRHRALQLTYATGVVQAALHEALAVPCWTIPSSTWKARTVGAGNASKAQVAAWVKAHGVELSSQDECDAYAIAAAGRAMLLAGSWEAVA